MSKSEKDTTSIPHLISTLIPLCNSLTPPLYKIISTNPLGCAILRDLAGDISTTSSVLSTLLATNEKYPVLSTIPVFSLFLRSLEREVRKVEMVLTVLADVEKSLIETPLTEEEEEKAEKDGKRWRVKGRGQPVGDPRQVAFQDEMCDRTGSLGKVMGTIEDTMDGLAFLGVMGKVKVLLEVPKG
jgi:hypothetical protein